MKEEIIQNIGENTVMTYFTYFVKSAGILLAFKELQIPKHFWIHFLKYNFLSVYFYEPDYPKMM